MEVMVHVCTGEFLPLLALYIHTYLVLRAAIWYILYLPLSPLPATMKRKFLLHKSGDSSLLLCYYRKQKALTNEVMILEVFRSATLREIIRLPFPAPPTTDHRTWSERGSLAFDMTLQYMCAEFISIHTP